MTIYKCNKCGKECIQTIPDKEQIACYSLCIITGYNDVAEWEEQKTKPCPRCGDPMTYFKALNIVGCEYCDITLNQ